MRIRDLLADIASGNKTLDDPVVVRIILPLREGDKTTPTKRVLADRMNGLNEIVLEQTEIDSAEIE